MENKSQVNQAFEFLFGSLERFFRAETVIGRPVVVGNAAAIPIKSISFGCAGGGTDAGELISDRYETGICAGAKITTAAVLVVNNGSVRMLHK